MGNPSDHLNGTAADWVDENELVDDDPVISHQARRSVPQAASSAPTTIREDQPPAFAPTPSPSTPRPPTSTPRPPLASHPVFDDDFEDATQVKNRDEVPSGIIPIPPIPAPPPSYSAHRPGELISGKYRLLHMLGKGGMGSVWAARNELTDRDFAIKFLLTDLAQNKEALHRFFLEARACGQIKHPAVVDVYDMGQAEDGSPYLVMELLEGEGFDARLQRSGVFRPGEAAAWIAFVARGLEEAHVRGLIHRDLKPGNIFFALDDRGDVLPKILDFGVSKATGERHKDFVKTTTGAVLGSPAYMSPEQAKGEMDIDGRSDVWSLGVILYEAVTGRVPFDAANYNALMVTIITKPHQPAIELAPQLPVELSQIIDQALQKDPRARIATARELADRLEAIAATLTSPAMPAFASKLTAPGASMRPPPAFATTESTSWSGSRKGKRARGSMFILAAVGAAVLAVGGAVAFVQTRPPMVAVAGRTAFALSNGLARLGPRLEQARTEAAAEKAKADQPPPPPDVVVLNPSELPPAKKTNDRGNPRGTSTGAPSSKPHAPTAPTSGGVDGPGF